MKLIDQIGTEVLLRSKAVRIISLVPSQTELLHDLGLETEVIGITKFCIHPNKWWKSKTRIGGTKNLNISRIKDLAPDLIIANKEENTKSEIELLQKDFTVYTSDIKNISDSLQMIRDIGILTDKNEKAKSICTDIELEFKKISTLELDSKRVAYLIWNSPIILSGKSTFIDHILSLLKLENASNKGRYPEVSLEELKNDNPDFLFLSSEPYPFKEKHKEFFKENLPRTKVLLVDGEMFSWYGSRLLKAPKYLRQLIIELND